MTRTRSTARPARPKRPSPPRQAPRTSILVASDWAPIRAFDEPMRTRPEELYGDLLPLLRRADLRIVNMECALTQAGTPAWKSGAVRCSAI